MADEAALVQKDLTIQRRASDLSADESTEAWLGLDGVPQIYFPLGEIGKLIGLHKTPLKQSSGGFNTKSQRKSLDFYNPLFSPLETVFHHF